MWFSIVWFVCVCLYLSRSLAVSLENYFMEFFIAAQTTEAIINFWLYRVFCLVHKLFGLTSKMQRQDEIPDDGSMFMFVCAYAFWLSEQQRGRCSNLSGICK